MASNIYFTRVYNSFVRQGLMKAIGAKLGMVERGTCEIILPYSDKITQQQGGFHGGAIGAIADIAAGYASLTVAPDDSEVTTVEYKINFIGAFYNGSLHARGKVLKEGKRILVTSADVFHVDDTGKETLCAVLQQTLVPVKKTY